MPNISRLTGGETARVILDENGLRSVRVVSGAGVLTDHYDPRTKVVSISAPNFRTPSVAGMAVAAHEAGHALQDAKSFGPLRLRTALLPIVAAGARFGPAAALVGIFIGFPALVQIGLLAFLGSVLFQFLALPVELDASRRALKHLKGLGLISERGERGVKQVLRAAAMTYVGATASSVAYLLYFFVAFFGRRFTRRAV